MGKARYITLRLAPSSLSRDFLWRLSLWILRKMISLLDKEREREVSSGNRALHAAGYIIGTRPRRFSHSQYHSLEIILSGNLSLGGYYFKV